MTGMSTWCRISGVTISLAQKRSGEWRVIVGGIVVFKSPDRKRCNDVFHGVRRVVRAALR